MNRVRSIVKSVLPSQIRCFLRTAHRDFVFRRAMRQFIKDPGTCANPESHVIAGLIYGWGNEDWSALDEIPCRLHTSCIVLTWVDIGMWFWVVHHLGWGYHEKARLSHWALEHKPEWAAKVQRYLNRYKLDSVVLCTNPLKNHGDYSWYDATLESMPDTFSLFVCDGPPGSTKGGRYDLASIMKERLKPGCVILLDDAGREQELAIARRWETELNSSFVILGSHKPYIEMTVMGRQ